MSTRARREREKQERRRSILKAAEKAFFENGFHHATVDSVAQRAEVSKGTVYLYFESKETILAHLLLEGLDDLVATLDEAYAATMELPPDEQLRALAEAYLTYFGENPQCFPFLMAMDRGRFREAVPGPLYERILEASLEGLTLAVRVLDRGCRQGVFECEDAQQSACVLWASLNGAMQLLEHPLRREMVGVNEEVLYQSSIETMIRALKPASHG